jgi:hypothetical protein
MIAVNFDIRSEALTASIRSLTRGLADKPALNRIMANAVGMEVRENLIARYTGRTTHGNFWQRVLNSMEVKSDEQSGRVSLVELGIGLRYNGGEVKPGKNPAAAGPNRGQLTRAIAVPTRAVPIVSGRQQAPAFMGLLAFVRARARGGDTSGYLVEGVEKTRKHATRRGAAGSKYIVPKPGGRLLYVLRRITRHTADPAIIPSNEVLSSAAIRSALNYIASFE